MACPRGKLEVLPPPPSAHCLFFSQFTEDNSYKQFSYRLEIIYRVVRKQANVKSLIGKIVCNYYCYQ